MCNYIAQEDGEDAQLVSPEKGLRKRGLKMVIIPQQEILQMSAAASGRKRGRKEGRGTEKHPIEAVKQRPTVCNNE